MRPLSLASPQCTVFLLSLGGSLFLSIVLSRCPDAPSCPLRFTLLRLQHCLARSGRESPACPGAGIVWLCRARSPRASDPAIQIHPWHSIFQADTSGRWVRLQPEAADFPGCKPLSIALCLLSAAVLGLVLWRKRRQRRQHLSHLVRKPEQWWCNLAASDQQHPHMYSRHLHISVLSRCRILRSCLSSACAA